MNNYRLIADVDEQCFYYFSLKKIISKAKPILELNQVGRVKILVFRNSGDTPAKIKEIE